MHKKKYALLAINSNFMLVKKPLIRQLSPLESIMDHMSPKTTLCQANTPLFYKYINMHEQSTSNHRHVQ